MSINAIDITLPIECHSINSMNPNREELLFQLALTKPAAERAAWLDRECGDDKALRARLDALLAAHEQPETLLATQTESARSTIKPDFPDGYHFWQLDRCFQPCRFIFIPFKSAVGMKPDCCIDICVLLCKNHRPLAGESVKPHDDNRIEQTQRVLPMFAFRPEWLSV